MSDTVPEISVDDLAAMSGHRLVDVREEHEYEEARVPGAELLPLATVPDHLDRFRAGETVYVICRSGGRSMKAAQFLRSKGIDAVNVAGGTLAWLDSGRPYDAD